MTVSLEKASSERQLHRAHGNPNTQEKSSAVPQWRSAGTGGSILCAKLHVGIIPLYQRAT